MRTGELVTFMGLGAVDRSVSSDNFYRGHNIKTVKFRFKVMKLL